MVTRLLWLQEQRRLVTIVTRIQQNSCRCEVTGYNPETKITRIRCYCPLLNIYDDDNNNNNNIMTFNNHKITVHLTIMDNQRQ